MITKSAEVVSPSIPIPLPSSDYMFSTADCVISASCDRQVVPHCNGGETERRESGTYAVNDVDLQHCGVSNGFDKGTVDDLHNKTIVDLTLPEKAVEEVASSSVRETLVIELADDSLQNSKETRSDVRPSSASTVITLVPSEVSAATSTVLNAPSACQTPGTSVKEPVVTWDNCRLAPDVASLSSDVTPTAFDCFIVSSNLKKRGTEAKMSSHLTQSIKKEKIDPQYEHAQLVSRPRSNTVQPFVIAPVASTPIPVQQWTARNVIPQPTIRISSSVVPCTVMNITPQTSLKVLQTNASINVTPQNTINLVPQNSINFTQQSSVAASPWPSIKLIPRMSNVGAHTSIRQVSVMPRSSSNISPWRSSTVPQVPQHSRTLSKVLLQSQTRPVHLIANTANKMAVAQSSIVLNHSKPSCTSILRGNNNQTIASGVLVLENAPVAKTVSNGVISNAAPTSNSAKIKLVDLSRHDVMQQLFEFPPDVNAYKAPLLPEHLRMAGSTEEEEEGFRCKPCGSIFSCLNSLTAHTNRRSADIRWFPTQGRGFRQFYNRCMLLAEVGRDKLSVSVTVVSPLDEEDVLSYECGECFDKVSSMLALQQHLDEGEGSDCKQCGVWLSGCRQQAHARLHMGIEPYVCPECSVRHHSKEAFLKHIHRKCYHANRKTRYACVTCSNVFTSVSQARAHVLAQHSPAYHKCHACPMAFRSQTAFRKHAGCHTPTASATKLHKCPLCDTVFKQVNQLSSHVTVAHVAKCTRRTLFICNLCKVTSTDHEVHVAHMMKMHQDRGDSVSKSAAIEKVTGASTTRQSDDLPRCDRCNVTFDDDAAYTRHMRKHRFMASRRSAVPPTLEVVCRVCQQKFSGDVELAEHERTQHGTQQSHACHLCALAFSDDEQLAAHHTVVHCATQVSPSQAETQGFTCPVCAIEDVKRIFKRRTQLAKHLAAVHRYDSPAALELPPPVLKPEVLEAPVPVKTMRMSRQGTYVCAKCDYHAEDQVVFKSHIAKHRSRECATQCPECGLCFAVIPALKRHLIIVHRIYNLMGYEQETGVELSPPSSPPPLKFTPLPTPDNPLQCAVCSEVFESTAVLRVHMRTHGMAFIRSSFTAPAAPSESVTVD